MKLRPLSGRSTIFLLSMTWPSPEVSLRSSGASAVTVTASVEPADLQPQVQSKRLAGGEPDAVTGQRPESAQLDAHPIGAGRQRLNGVTAVRARDHRAGQVGSGGDNGDGHARQGGARLVHDVPRQRRCANLRAEARRGDSDSDRDPQARACPTPTSEHPDPLECPEL